MGPQCSRATLCIPLTCSHFYSPPDSAFISLLFFPFALSPNDTLIYSQAFTIFIMSVKMSTKATSPFLFPLPGTHVASSNSTSWIYLPQFTSSSWLPGPIKWRLHSPMLWAPRSQTPLTPPPPFPWHHVPDLFNTSDCSFLPSPPGLALVQSPYLSNPMAISQTYCYFSFRSIPDPVPGCIFLKRSSDQPWSGSKPATAPHCLSE